MLAFMGFFICVSVHWNARMTEMERSGIEVLLVFADNVLEITKQWGLGLNFLPSMERRLRKGFSKWRLKRKIAMGKGRCIRNKNGIHDNFSEFNE